MSQTEMGQRRYFPFGASRSSTGDVQTERLFTGQLWHGSSRLYYYSDGSAYGRFYNPSTGLFTQPDPIVQVAIGSNKTIESLGENAKAWNERRWNDLVYPNPQLLNRYSYAANNPLSHNDPSGHAIPILAIIAVGAVAGGVINATSAYLQGGSFEEVVAAGAKGFVAGGVGTGLAMLASPLLGAGASVWLTGAVGGAASGGGARVTLNVFDILGGKPTTPLEGVTESIIAGGVLGAGAGWLANMNLQAGGVLASKPYLRQTGVDKWLFGPRPSYSEIRDAQIEAVQGGLGVLSTIFFSEPNQQDLAPFSPGSQLYYAPSPYAAEVS